MDHLIFFFFLDKGRGVWLVIRKKWLMKPREGEKEARGVGEGCSYRD